MTGHQDKVMCVSWTQQKVGVVRFDYFRPRFAQKIPKSVLAHIGTLALRIAHVQYIKILT